MKKFYATLFSFAAVCSLSLSAQQLPNAGFEEAWGDCTPWDSKNNQSTQGKTPASWTISHVYGSFLAKTTVGENVAGYNSNSAVRVYVVEKMGQYIPGYFTLGTPWSTSKGYGGNKDGGTFGGIKFTYRPDAVSFQYKSTGNAQPAVICYSWTGTYTQTDVPANIALSGNPTTCTMTDRDRNILGMETSQGESVSATDGAKCISKLETRMTAATNDWTYATYNIEYLSTETPEKFNIIFAADDYFSTTPTKDNDLTVDDVKLIYYSRLATLTIGGQSVAGFDADTYTYNVDTELPAESEFAFTTMGNSGSAHATLSLDQANATATITVTNSNAGGEDVDGQTSHIYTIQFNKSTEKPEKPNIDGNKYDGSLIVTMGESVIPSQTSVYIAPNGDGTCTFLLPDFSIDLGEGPQSLGDIQVDNVTMTSYGTGATTYKGNVDGFQLAEGAITANIEIEGTEANGILQMYIHVKWIDPDSGDVIAPIEVTFNGKIDTASIETIDADNTDAPVEFYDIYGRQVNGSALTPGFYIRRQGTDVTKILVK